MVANAAASQLAARRPRWRWLVQFSLRSLLIFMTLAAVACWWFFQPKVREEQLGQSPLRIRRQIRLQKFDPAVFPLPDPDLDRIIESGQHFAVVNVGQWRLFDQSGNLLVAGHYDRGKQHGRWTTYHTNGRKAAEGLMNRGQKDGLWRTWDEEGHLLGEVTYSATPAGAAPAR
jgi:MORN repeat protein